MKNTKKLSIAQKKIKGMTAAKLAEIAGVGRATASRWQLGKAKPSDARRKKIKDVLGIDFEDWEKFDTPKKKSAVKKEIQKIEAEESGYYPAQPPIDAPQLDHIRHSLLCIRRDLMDPELSPVARSKVRNDESKLVNLVLKLENELELKEDRIVREHAAFKAHCKKILIALAPFPKALKAVAEVLDE